jgi:membrane protease YdiL (CAAX protease family)
MLATKNVLTPYLRTLHALFVGFIVSLFAIVLLMLPFGGLNKGQFFHLISSLLNDIVYYSCLLAFLFIFLKPRISKKRVDFSLFLKTFTLFIFFFLTLDILSTWIKLPSLSEPIFDDQFKQNPVIFFVTVVVVGPIMEELVFRGAILGYLRSHSSKLPALLFSSFLFGLIHFSLDQIVWGSIAGIFLGYAYMKSQNILVPIFFHMLNNGMYFILKSYGDASSIWDLFNH